MSVASVISFFIIFIAKLEVVKWGSIYPGANKTHAVCFFGLVAPALRVYLCQFTHTNIRMYTFFFHLQYRTYETHFRYVCLSCAYSIFFQKLRFLHSLFFFLPLPGSVVPPRIIANLVLCWMFGIYTLAHVSWQAFFISRFVGNIVDNISLKFSCKIFLYFYFVRIETGKILGFMNFNKKDKLVDIFCQERNFNAFRRADFEVSWRLTLKISPQDLKQRSIFPHSQSQLCINVYTAKNLSPWNIQQPRIHVLTPTPSLRLSHSCNIESRD